MDIPSLTELVDRVDEMIATFEHDENRFYVVIDIAHQLRDELQQLITLDPAEDE